MLSKFWGSSIEMLASSKAITCIYVAIIDKVAE